MPVIARRMERVSSFLAMDVLSAAAAKERRGDSVVHMEVGPTLGACAQGGSRGRQGDAGERAASAASRAARGAGAEGCPTSI